MLKDAGSSEGRSHLPVEEAPPPGGSGTCSSPDKGEFRFLRSRVGPGKASSCSTCLGSSSAARAPPVVTNPA